jgi:Integrase core domain
VVTTGARLAQHFPTPSASAPNDQDWIESFFGHLKGESPHLQKTNDPDELELEMDRLRTHFNTVRLHEGIGYVTPHDEHHSRGKGDPCRTLSRPGRCPSPYERAVQIDRFGAVPTASLHTAGAAHSGGSARGYQGTARPFSSPGLAQ